MIIIYATYINQVKKYSKLVCKNLRTFAVNKLKGQNNKHHAPIWPIQQVQ